MKKIAAALLAVSLILLTACANSETDVSGNDASQAESQNEVKVLRLATDLSEDYVSTVSLKKFAEEVKEKTNGRIEIDIYAGGQLGEEASCIEQVQMGALDFTKSSMGALTSYNETLSVLGLPYLFKSTDHMWRVLNSEIGQAWLDSMSGTSLFLQR